MRRKPRIKTLLTHLHQIEAGLQHAANDGAYIPSPREFNRLQELCATLPKVVELAKVADTQCQARIHAWQNTPYTPAQLWRKRVIAFLGWWFAASATLSYAILGWFTSWFPTPLHMLVASGVIGLLVLVALVVKEHHFLDSDPE
jgi:hypothetical protein